MAVGKWVISIFKTFNPAQCPRTVSAVYVKLLNSSPWFLFSALLFFAHQDSGTAAHNPKAQETLHLSGHDPGPLTLELHRHIHTAVISLLPWSSKCYWRKRIKA